MSRFRPLPFLLAAALAAGCGGAGGSFPSDGGAPADQAAMGGADLTMNACGKPVPCTDRSIQELSLYKKVSTRAIDNTPEKAGGFASRVDATGGGFNPTESYVYAKFTDQGLVRVAVSDEQAFESKEWDIAFRRYVVRLNSGVSGPSCVVGSLVPGGVKYDALTKAPDDLVFDSEAFYDAKCMFVPDSSGLEAPGTVLQDFWKYSGCVQMTGALYVVRRADGRRVKLTITSYYDPVASQQACDRTGALPMGAVGGQLRFRWAFLDR